MKRPMPYFISAFVLSGLLAGVLTRIDPARVPSPDVVMQGAAVATLERVLGRVTSSGTALASPEAQTWRGLPLAVPDEKGAMPLDAVKIRAIRNGHEYGWVQLPKGMPVTLVRVEGDTVLVRYDEVVFRVTREQLAAGVVRPLPKKQLQLVSL